MIKKGLVVILLVVTVLVFYFGNISWNHKNEKKINEAIAKINVENAQKLELSKKTWLGKVNPTVVLIGSSVTKGTGASKYDNSWAGLLEQFFKKTNQDVKYINYGVGGYTTSDVIKNGILDKAIAAAPDAVIFETCLLNDFSKLNTNISKANIETIVSALKSKDPNIRVIIMPPNEPTTIDTIRNPEGLTYRQYVNKTAEFIKSKGWTYIDFWNDYENKLKNGNLKLKDVLFDGIHPNDKGYQIWFDSIRQDFTKN